MRPLYALAGLTAIVLGAIYTGLIKCVELFEDIPDTDSPSIDVGVPTHAFGYFGDTMCGHLAEVTLTQSLVTSGCLSEVDCLVCLDSFEHEWLGAVESHQYDPEGGAL